MQIAEKLGISNADQKLPSKGLRDAVIASDTYAKQDMDIHGVPHFIIGSGRKGLALHGAQSVEAFELALEKQIASLAKTWFVRAESPLKVERAKPIRMGIPAE